MAASRAARRLAALFAAEGEAGTPAGARARGRGGRRAPGLARARAAVAAWARRRAAVGLLGSRLFWKFASLLAVLVLSASVITFATSQWYAYRESCAAQFRLLREQALAASGRIEAFVGGIAHELGWVTQLPWSAQTPEMRVQDAVRLLRQAPAVSDLRLLDPAGREQVFVSRTELDRTGPGRDLAADPLFREARDAGSAFGPVTFRGGSEPFMTVAAAGPGGRTGVAVADVNLKLVWDVIRRVRVGETGRAFVVDRDGRLVAHPDIDRVLRATDLSRLPHIREATGAPAGATGVRAGEAAVEAGEDGAPALASWVAIPGLGWAVVAELPRTEADAPLRAAIGRTALLLLGGVAVSTGAGLLLARHLVGPIRLLGQGAARIGAGELGHRLVVRTGDELQVLAERFNAMSDALREAAARNERLGRLKRFLSPQLAELVNSSGGEDLLESHRRLVTVVFCDLRGFTRFANRAEPEAVMRVLNEYHAELGRLIFAFGGTLERYMGDGLMVLFNDPLPCPDPSVRAVRLAVAMRERVGRLSEAWARSGHALGFGIGIAEGVATLGRIGFEGRFDYSAIGTVCNLAARLCAAAEGGQILVDERVARQVGDAAPLAPVGNLSLKGFADPVPVFDVRADAPLAEPPAGGGRQDEPERDPVPAATTGEVPR